MNGHEYDRLCFILVPLKGKINVEPRLQNKILLPFKGRFEKLNPTSTPITLMWESPQGDSWNSG